MILTSASLSSSRADVSGDLNEAREAANKIFAENKDVTAVMCGNDQIALGALVAARTAGLTDVKIYGVDGSPDLKKELQKTDSLIRGTSAQSPIKLGKESAKIGFAILNGDDYEKTTYLDVCFIDASFKSPLTSALPTISNPFPAIASSKPVILSTIEFCVRPSRITIFPPSGLCCIRSSPQSCPAALFPNQ